MRAVILALAVVSSWLGLLPVISAVRFEHLRLEGVDGDVTTNEYESFIAKLHELPPPPSNNIGNLMVYEAVGGGKLHGMQTFYLFTHDRRVLEKAVIWSDAFLHARNDPLNGRLQWTGKRELCWPNKESNDVHALYSGAENGDVIEHIVNTAKLILENPSVQDQAAPQDIYGFGRTYLDRARTYVRECQRSAETTIVPWYVTKAKAGYRLYRPDTSAYFKASGDKGPLPWNQQQCVVGGLLRLAQCHRLLNDGNTNIGYYEKITADAANWFFSTCKLVNSRGRACYQWSYMATQDPLSQPEDTGHSFYDVYVLRAYQANLGPTRAEMQRLINTARFVMHLGTNRFSGIINGTSNERRYERKYLNYGWIEMSVLDRDFYRLLASAVLTSHQYLEDIPVEAAVLNAKHYWATRSSGPEIQEVLEDARGLPPLQQKSADSQRHVPVAVIIGLTLGLSELVLALTRRAKSNTGSNAHRPNNLIWLVFLVAIPLAVGAAYHVQRWPAEHRQVLVASSYGLLLLGLALRWYPALLPGRLCAANAMGADQHSLHSGPYRFIRHPGYVGSLLAVLALGLSFGNWASLLIVLVPIGAVLLWRAHVDEQALAIALGQAYGDYARRTKRLIPGIY